MSEERRAATTVWAVESGLSASGNVNARMDLGLGADHSGDATEPLDELARTAPLRALALFAALAGFVTVAAIFSWFYRAPTKVKGEGVLVAGQEELVPISARGSGRLLWIAAEGTMIAGSEDQRVVAQIAQEDLQERIWELDAELRERIDENQTLSRFDEAEQTKQREAVRQFRDALAAKEKHAAERQKTAGAIVKREQDLNNRMPGAISTRSRLDSLTLLHQIGSEIDNARAQLKELEHDRLRDENQRQREALERQFRVRSLKTKIAGLREQLDRKSKILTSEAGSVRQIFKPLGSMVQEGEIIALLEKGRGQGLAETKEAILFVPAEDGMRIREGQQVEIVPTTIRREEHGFIRGVVTGVSELPPTREAALAKLKHSGMVQRFFEAKPAGVYTMVEVRLAALPSSSAPRSASQRNSLVWSSKSGNEQPIDPWTLCDAAVRVEDQRLISLAIPWLKRQSGLE